MACPLRSTGGRKKKETTAGEYNGLPITTYGRP